MKDAIESRRDKIREYKQLYDMLYDAVVVAETEVKAAVQSCEFVHDIAQKITNQAMAEESWISEWEPDTPNYDTPDEIMKMQADWVQEDLEAKLVKMLADVRSRRDYVGRVALSPGALAHKEGDNKITDDSTGFFVVDGEVHILEPTGETV